ncbi:MAG TPA: NAD(+) synthase [Pseudomonadales bacterium]|nr:NAD(+) synthase [Pseudomonadales bacterium]
MKVCLAQINTTPGDFARNIEAIKRGIDVASKAHCDVVLFPELCIPGYLSQDLIYHPAYIDRNLTCLEELTAHTKGCHEGLHVVVGYIDRNPGRGKPFLNRAAVLRSGEIVGSYTKQLLPFYDVFDELRYYEPGTSLLTIDIAGCRTGITICEDLWNDKGSDDYSYADNPMQKYREAGVDVVLSLNSSPYVHDKSWQRLKVIAPSTVDGPTVVYVNQRGGQDELVFDGQSFVVRNGDLLHLSTQTDQDSFDIVDTQDQPILEQVYKAEQRTEVLSRSVGLYELLVLCLRDYVRKSGFRQLVVASSGGVDSAVVCKIACDAVGPRNVHAIRMPSIYSSQHSRHDALELHQNLGCWDYEVEISHESLVAMLNGNFSKHAGEPGNLVGEVMEAGKYGKVADENIQARLRDVYVMHFSNAYGAMPLSTGNKTESACGYYTHFDMNFSFAPIKDLYKHQVFSIAQQAREIPDNIWKKPPSAELAPGQTDEASLLSYSVLDPIVYAYVEDYVSTFPLFREWARRKLAQKEVISLDVDVLERWMGNPQAPLDFARMIGLMGRMEYKRRQTCPGTKVSKVAFGIGRRIPIVDGWS